MSQENTYRSTVLPSEAAMIPAVEVEQTPPPAAEETQEAQPSERTQAAETPAQERPYTRTNASISLERDRNRSRALHSANLNWVDAGSAPLGRQPAQNERAAPRSTPNGGQPQVRRTTTGGAALSTLMRSAARRYTPAPAMRVPGMPRQE